jgi:hypothetical protein
LDKDGNVVGTIDGDPLLPVILPGQVMPFESGIFGNEPSLDQWMSETIAICGTWGSTDLLSQFDPRGLKLQDIKTTKDANGLTVTGKVFNGTSQPADNVWIMAAVYDHKGRFAGFFWTALESAIPSQKTERFSFDSQGDPHDPVGIAGSGYSYVLWVGHGSSFGMC